MKKAVAFASSLLLVAGLLTGCGSSETSSEAVEVTNQLEAIQEAGKLVIATSPDFAPSEFIDLTKTGQEAVVGADISLAYYIAEQLGVELVIEQMSFEACLAAVPAKAVDISISGFAKTDERAENMECSDYYYWTGEESGHGLLVLAENAGFTSADEFAGMTVAAQVGSIQEEYAISELPEDITMEPISDLANGVLMLMNGKVDAVSFSYSAGLQYADNYPELGMAEFKYEANESGTVILGQKGETELMAFINEVLAQAAEEGLMEQWYAEASELADSLGVE